MTTTAHRSTVLVNDETLSSVRHEVERERSVPASVIGFGALLSDGSVQQLPPEVTDLLHKTLQTLAEQGTVTVGSVPAELTSTTAARLLGVSRPTLLKLAAEGKIRSFKKKSHTRFLREDVLTYRDSRRAQQARAMNEVMELADQLGD